MFCMAFARFAFPSSKFQIVALHIVILSHICEGAPVCKNIFLSCFIIFRSFQLMCVDEVHFGGRQL